MRRIECRAVACILSLLWAGWWMVFGLATAIGTGYDAVGILLYGVVPGLIFLSLSLIAMRWPLAGGLTLLLVGVGLFVMHPIAASIEGALALAFPPVLAGILHLDEWTKSGPVANWPTGPAPLTR
jgi:hypothetical protein